MSDSLQQLQYLLQSLGDNKEQYLKHARMWFKMMITKEEFEKETEKFMTEDQKYLHTQILRTILRKTAGIISERLELASFFQEPFEPVNSVRYKDCERNVIEDDKRCFVTHERVLPDRSFVLGRMYHNAWEAGLQGPTQASADLLVVATQHFLKNIITAVISRRKGYKVNDNKFIHSLQHPGPSPWLRNVAKHAPQIYETMRCDLSEEEILVPGERLTNDQLEHEEAFKLAASDNCNNLPPISLIELFMTLSVYPSIIASDFLYSITRERIITKIEHPTFDD